MEARTLKVLFVCVRNAARSQMAEAWLNHLHPDLAQAKSAGFEPGILDPMTIQVMKEAGIDISQSPTKGVLDLFSRGERFDRVIGVSDQSADERCPFFPGLTERIFWSFPNPAHFEGTEEEKLAQTRALRDDIKAHIEKWAAEEKERQVAVAAHAQAQAQAEAKAQETEAKA
jgi:arsenate reductase